MYLHLHNYLKINISCEKQDFVLEFTTQPEVNNWLSDIYTCVTITQIKADHISSNLEGSL